MPSAAAPDVITSPTPGGGEASPLPAAATPGLPDGLGPPVPMGYGYTIRIPPDMMVGEHSRVTSPGATTDRIEVRRKSGEFTPRLTVLVEVWDEPALNPVAPPIIVTPKPQPLPPRAIVAHWCFKLGEEGAGSVYYAPDAAIDRVTVDGVPFWRARVPRGVDSVSRGLLLVGLDEGRRITMAASSQEPEDSREYRDLEAALASFLRGQEVPDPQPKVVWNEEGRRLTPNTRARVTAFAISPDGRWAAVGDSNGVVHVWDVPGQAPPRSLEIDRGLPIAFVSISADGARLAAGAYGANARSQLWDVPAGRPLRELPDLTRFAFSPDGAQAALTVDKQLVVIAAADGTEAARRPFDQELTGLAWSRNGKLLAVGDRHGGLFVWYPAQDRLLLDAPQEERGDAIDELAFAHDNRSLFAQDEKGIVRRDFAPPGPASPIGSRLRDGFEIQPTGRVVVQEPQHLSFWDAETGADLGAAKYPEEAGITAYAESRLTDDGSTLVFPAKSRDGPARPIAWRLPEPKPAGAFP